MKYYVIYASNGDLQLGQGAVTEWTDLEAAKGKFHDLCYLMWKESSVNTACVAIIDNALNVVSGYREYISK